MKLTDTNAVIRYMYNDIPEQAEETRRQLESGVEITMEVLSECVFVLQSVYEVPRKDISIALTAFLDEACCQRGAVAREALRAYAMRNLGFIDCILLAEAMVNKREILTFDKKLSKTITCEKNR